jgi:ribosomal protein S12 methylthiotransferase
VKHLLRVVFSSIGTLSVMPKRYWIETLGCPKNQVDSDKIAGSLELEGYELADDAQEAELVVVNTCAFIDAARQESTATIRGLNANKPDGTRLVVTGCLVARSKTEVATAFPGIELRDVGESVDIRIGTKPKPEHSSTFASLDFLERPRPRPQTPWAYVKVAEGCDRRCGFCAIPSFRGPQRSRARDAILSEIEALDVREVVLVAQDLASYGRDDGNSGAIVDLVKEAKRRVERVRLLYLYPSSLTNELIDTIVDTGVSYFDLSLQHVARPHLRRMRRYGNAERFLERIDKIRATDPQAALRSSFILGYPGETEEDHDELLAFLEQARLDWAGFFTFSEEKGTLAATLDDKVDHELALERLREANALQDSITASKRRELIGNTVSVLVDAIGTGRTFREAPEIDGVVSVDSNFGIGTTHDVRVFDAIGPDLVAHL